MEKSTKYMIAGGLVLAFFVFRKSDASSAGVVASLSAMKPGAAQKVAALLALMEALGTPFDVNETLRTASRQAALFAQGRTAPGPIVSQLSGKPGQESRHQSGNAADLVLRVSGWRGGGDPPTGKFDLGVSGGRVVRPLVNAAWKTMGREAQALGLRWLGGPSGGALDPVSGLAFDAPHVEVPGMTIYTVGYEWFSGRYRSATIVPYLKPWFARVHVPR